jgi:hypothetical protein
MSQFGLRGGCLQSCDWVGGGAVAVVCFVVARQDASACTDVREVDNGDVGHVRRNGSWSYWTTSANKCTSRRLSTSHWHNFLHRHSSLVLNVASLYMVTTSSRTSLLSCCLLLSSIEWVWPCGVQLVLSSMVATVAFGHSRMDCRWRGSSTKALLLYILVHWSYQ